MSQLSTVAEAKAARAQVQVSEEVWREIKAEAAREGRNPSETAEDAFRLYLRVKRESK